MQREPVQSSSVGSIGYDARKHLLEVEFRNGGVYRYLDVPEAEYQALRDADSVGRHLNQEIKPFYSVIKVRSRPRKADQA
ncbi:MAG TPA: KTSC domain-containing protein [Longimicrobium sp.]|nr:KTSC domain-containing protein [Longimicrobium sp.]